MLANVDWLAATVMGAVAGVSFTAVRSGYHRWRDYLARCRRCGQSW